jgi:hypothetical protein
MLIKSKSSSRLIFGWPILAILLSFIAVAPVHSEQFHYNRNGSVILPSRHTDSFTKFFEDTIKHVVDTGINQVKSIVSGTKNLVTSTGQIIASVLAYATGNKELGDKLAHDAASSAKNLGNDATGLLSSGGDLYNKTAEDLNDLVPHLGTIAGMLVSLTPIGPEVGLARGFADVKSAFENGGINAALQAAAFAAIDAAPGGAGKAAKGAKEAIAAEKAASDLAKLSTLIKQAAAETKVAADAAKLNKFVDYLDKLNKVLRPKDFVPGRHRDEDGKLQGTGGSNWEDRRDVARKMTGYDELKAKDKAAQQQAAKNEPGVDRPRNAPRPALRTHGGPRLDSVVADEPPPNRDVGQAARDRAYNQERQRIEDEKRQADLTEKQRLENEQREADLRDKQRIQDDKRQADLREKQRLEDEQRQADLSQKQRQENEKRQADEQDRQRIIADQKRQADLRERQRIAEENKRRADEENQRRIEQENRQADLREKRRLTDENKRRADEENQRRIEEENRQANLKEKQRLADEKRQADDDERQRIADEKQRADEEESQRLADENRRRQEENQRPQPEPAVENRQPSVLSETHTEDEEVQAQKEYLEKLRSEKEQPAAQPQKQSKDDDANDGGGNN